MLFVSLHQWPLYPGTGRATEVGTGAGRGTTMNVPLPPGATGDVYLRAFDEVDRAGRRALRPDVAADLGRLRRPPRRPADRARPDRRRLPAADGRALQLVPPGRCVAMLEGGYDLDALSSCATSVLGDAGRRRPRRRRGAEHGGPGPGGRRRRAAGLGTRG